MVESVLYLDYVWQAMYCQTNRWRRSSCVTDGDSYPLLSEVSEGLWKNFPWSIRM